MARQLHFFACCSLFIGCASGTPIMPRTDGGLGCPPDLAACGGSCVDLIDDRDHCGACGAACADGEACRGGMCAVACPRGQSACEVGGATICVSTESDPMNCGDCGVSCPAGQVCSVGACAASCAAGLTACTLADGSTACATLNTDAAHCGGCGNRCAPSESCTGGTCGVVCPMGQMACGGLCVDLANDDANCGGCGTACGASETCRASGCVTVCPPGAMDCDGICRDTATDSGHCGRCNMPCGSGEACIGGTCTLSCPPGQTVCAGSCVFTDRDPLHCDRCGNLCPSPVGGSASCTAGACSGSCPPGQTNCSGTCRDLATDSSNCGACARPCAGGTICRTASCVPDLPPLGGTTFRIDSLSASGCTVVEHEALTGDDRGGVAVSSSQMFVTGDTATARFSRTDLTAGVALADQNDALVSNLRNGEIYALADAVGRLPGGGGTITRLLHLSSSSGQPLTTGHVTLSTPISASGTTFGSTVGIFAGYDRVVIHNSARVYSIALGTGVVTDLGAMPMPSRQACENWAYWGIAETDGANTNLIFAQNNTTVLKVRVPTGATVGTFSFTNLSDMCSISAAPTLNRWYFHHEYASQFTTVSSEHVGYCNATFDTVGGNFRVLTMTGTGCATYDHNTLTGDDRGGIAVSLSYVFYTGDAATVRFSRASFPPATAERLGRVHDGMIANLRTGQVYVLGNAGRPLLGGGGQVTELILLSATSGIPSGTVLTLATPIDATATPSGSTVGLFSGYDRAVIHAGARVYHIDLTTGAVLDLGSMARPINRAACESWAYWGVAELFGGQLWISYVNTADAIERSRVPDGMTMTVAPFTDLSDMCGFTVVPTLNRWYFHHEYASQFIATTGEHIGFCGAIWSSP